MITNTPNGTRAAIYARVSTCAVVNAFVPLSAGDRSMTLDRAHRSQSRRRWRSLCGDDSALTGTLDEIKDLDAVWAVESVHYTRKGGTAWRTRTA